MKKTLLSLCAAAIGAGAFAQNNQVSLGIDLAMPMGDFGDAYSLGVGPTAGFELPFGKAAATVQLSYMILMPKEDVGIDKASMLPLQAGLKYYFMEEQRGVYGHLQLGMHMSSYTTEDVDLGPLGTVEGESESSSNFSWAIGAGYALEKLDIGLRYNSISPDSDVEGAEASTYLGIRVAYLINL